jgi:hypothetical protein
MEGPVGAAPLSACNAKTKTAVRIGVHLNIYGIRHNRLFQVIDVVPSRSVASLAARTAPRSWYAALGNPLRPEPYASAT